MQLNFLNIYNNSLNKWSQLYIIIYYLSDWIQLINIYCLCWCIHSYSFTTFTSFTTHYNNKKTFNFFVYIKKLVFLDKSYISYMSQYINVSLLNINIKNYFIIRKIPTTKLFHLFAKIIYNHNQLTL